MAVWSLWQSENGRLGRLVGRSPVPNDGKRPRLLSVTSYQRISHLAMAISLLLVPRSACDRFSIEATNVFLGMFPKTTKMQNALIRGLALN